MIARKTIDDVLESCNIVEVVGDYLTLKKSGTHYKCCCCFHDDKNPSLTIFPKTGTYKCFSCGKQGNSIRFLMDHEKISFQEAVTILAKKYGIAIEEKEYTAQEEADYNTRKAMYIANEQLAVEYEHQLELCPEAKQYAYNRWGEKYCKIKGIGYCPKYAKLVSQLAISDKVAKALKVTNKQGYDFFFDRITIPIRDRWNNVIGFIARTMDPNEKNKYLNSQDSLAYNKSTSIFGIDTAWKEAARMDKVYIVEGAPDCMRLQSIGIENTLAPLGTSLTEEQFRLIKKMAGHICFLPDADPPKEGQEFGPGIDAVKRNGTTAMQMGFTVSVKQIPVLPDRKQDPDSYCRTKLLFDELTETDFVLWMADLLFVEGMTTAERSKVINEIAGLLIYIKDDTALGMYIKELVRYDGNKTMWKKAIENKRKEKDDKEAKDAKDKEENLYLQHGFNVADNHYFTGTENGDYIWSNFIMKPLFHIKDSKMPKRIFVLTNEEGREELVEMKQEDLVSLARFRLKVEGIGNFVWNAHEAELNKLKKFLYKYTETAVEIKQLGWQKKECFYAFGNGIFYDGEFKEIDKYGIVRIPKLGNFYLPANSDIYKYDDGLFQFERKFVHLGLSTISLRTITDQMFKVYGNNGKIGFCFFLATLFRDIVTKEARSFPILNLFGPKGSGKSELGITLMSFFVIENTPPNMQISSVPGLGAVIASVSDALVHIDEFKNETDLKTREIFKSLWDGSGRTKMNMDLDKKSEMTKVDSGIILSGQEMATVDVALFSRFIFLSFPRSEFSSEEKKEFQELKRLRSNGLTHITLNILQYRKKIEKSFHGMYQETINDVIERLKDVSVEDRIMFNWVALLSVLRCLEPFLDISISYKEMIDVCLEGLQNQNDECSQNNELAAFWKMVQFLASQGELIEGGDYKIKHCTKFETDKVKSEWPKSKEVLFLQKTRIFMLYKIHAKAVGDKVLPDGSLKFYLEHSNAFLGNKNQRYDVYYKGVLQYEQSKNGKSVKITESQRSFCFDYKMLMNMYEINLSNVRRSDENSFVDSNGSLSEEDDIIDDDAFDDESFEDTD